MAKPFPQAARAVVIGGGIVGLSVLYHLAKAGWREVVLLERNQLTSGTTWHSAALVSPMRGSKGMTALAKYSGDLYESLIEETGVETGMRRCGHLNIAANEARLEELKHAMSTARAFDLETHLVSPAEVKAKWPLMHTDDLLAAVWTPSSGRADPSNICQALAKGAKSAGARILEETAVTGIARRNGRVAGVETTRGTIACDVVVNCAGLWGRQVADLAGLRAPLHACEHFYLLTEPIEGVTTDLPVMRDGDAHLYAREEVGGLLVGCFESNPKPLPLSKLPKDAAYILLNEDWDHFAPMMEGAIHRIPALESAGVRMLLNGPESFTLDNNPLMGEAPNLRGFWFCCGMNSAGVALGGGAGWATASWIVEGAPPVDVTAADVKRFPAVLDTAAALHARVSEVLAHHLTIPWPGREYETARNLRRSALHQALERKGARFGPRSGWEKPLYFDPAGAVDPAKLRFGRPAWFEAQAREHRAARESLALFDQSSFAKLLVQGPDAEAVLQRLAANDISRPGRTHFTALLNASGGMESDLTVTRLSETEFFLVTGTAQGARDRDWIAKRIREQERATVAEVTGGWATLLVTGPDARAALQHITPADLSNRAFPFGDAREIEVAMARTLAVRVSFAGELGWELHVPTDQALCLYEALMDAAHELRPAGAHALNSLRLEKAFRSWGHDIGPRDTPLEAGLGFAVAWRKNTDFIGRDALLRQRDGGLARRLVSFTLDHPAAFPTGHHPILRDGRIAGEVCSGAWGYSLGKAVALGWVEKGSVETDDILSDRFEIEIACARFAATSHLRSPYDPGGERLRA